MEELVVYSLFQSVKGMNVLEECIPIVVFISSLFLVIDWI